MARVQTCTTWNETTQTCDASSWVEQPALLPELTLEDGKKIGDEIVFSLVLVLLVKLFLKPSTHKSR